MHKNIPYGRQHIDQTDIDAVIETLQSDYLTQGPKIIAFEQAFAEYVGAEYAIAVSNGTAALHLSALALGIKDGDRIITSPITFAASANGFAYTGATVEFVDIDPNTALMDLDALEDKLKSSPKGTYKAIVPVDFAGLPVDVERVRSLANIYGCFVVEDACHAPGASIITSQGQEELSGAGHFSDLVVFSFHPVKHIACGEGGMITTNDKNLYDQLCRLRTHGITKDENLLTNNHGGWYYEMIELGYNYRLTDIQCALGLSQLAKADDGIMRRRYIADKYRSAFTNTAVDVLDSPADKNHAYHLFVILVNNRKEVYDHLIANRIFAQIHYIPVHLMPYYQNIGFKQGDFPNAESYYNRCLSLPMFPTLTDEEQAFVIEKVLEVAK